MLRKYRRQTCARVRLRETPECVRGVGCRAEAGQPERPTVCHSCFPSLCRCCVLWSPGLCVVLVWFSCSESLPFKHFCGPPCKPLMISTFFYFFFTLTPKSYPSRDLPPLMNTCAIYRDVSSGVLARFFFHFFSFLTAELMANRV